jgi:hypothetical protein
MPLSAAVIAYFQIVVRMAVPLFGSDTRPAHYSVVKELHLELANVASALPSRFLLADHPVTTVPSMGLKERSDTLSPGCAELQTVRHVRCPDRPR